MKRLIKEKYIYRFFALAVAILFVAKFAGPKILRLYVEMGVGSCRQIPVLCLTPEDEVYKPETDKKYIETALEYNFSNLTIRAPAGFTIIQEQIKKARYKRRQGKDYNAVIYLLRQEPDFFVNLFPQLKNKGVVNDYEFIRRVMYSRLNEVKNFTDVFFAIMKGIFIPDLGSQNKLKMIRFALSDRKGFINYNIDALDAYYDCNVIDDAGIFFKLYIKDKGPRLDLDKVLAIVSSLQKKA